MKSLLAPVIAVVSAVLLLHGALVHYPCVDEVAHLPAGYSHWKYSDFKLYAVNPPLVRVVAAIPLVVLQRDPFLWEQQVYGVGYRPEFAVGRRAVDQYKIAYYRWFFYPRVLCILLFVIGGLGLYGFVTRTVGPLAGIVCCAYFFFCPNNLAFAQTILPDSLAMCAGIWAAHSASYLVRDPKYGQLFVTGFWFGIALLTKLTWAVGVAVLILVALLRITQTSSLRFAAKARFLFCAFWVLSLTSLTILNLGYLCKGSFRPLSEYRFCSHTFGGSDASTVSANNRFLGSWYSALPVPLPQSYVMGADYLKFEVESKYWSFLDGEWRLGSWPHYYLMTTLYKTPEPLLIAALLGAIVFVVGWWRGLTTPDLVSMVILLTIPAVICFVSISAQGGFNHHHRYVLMIYPPMFVFASLLASPLARQALSRTPGIESAPPASRRIKSFEPNRQPLHWTQWLAIALLTLSVASALRVHPHYTSYFNLLSGGSENGWKRLGNSNIDWGQDLLEVDKWIKQHPECRPLAFELDYFDYNGELFGLPNASPPELSKDASVEDVRTDETQWWIVSVKKLYNLPGQDGLEYLRKLEPVDKIAYAYQVYRIDPRQTPPKQETIVTISSGP